MVEGLSPGWYPNTDGNLRYWDGEKWLDINPPNDSTPTKSPKSKKRSSKRRKIIIALSLVGALLIAGGSATYFIIQAQEAEQARIDAEKAAEEQANKERLEKEAEEKRERDYRATIVSQIESSVKEMATDHAKDGVIDHSPIEVTCDPVDGSYENLLASTTTFQCFVATERVSGGQYSGYYYHATINWDSGQYSYGFGSP